MKYVTKINNNVWNVCTMGPVKGYFPSPGFCHPHYLPILSHFQTACVACACILFEITIEAVIDDKTGLTIVLDNVTLHNISYQIYCV